MRAHHTSGSDSQAPSPTSSNTTATRSTPPPRFLPPHLHDEVLPSREEGASSPSAALAEVTIDSASSVDMSGSENGAAGNHAGAEQRRGAVSPGRTIGARSASPAKRSAADMEEVSNAQADQQKLNGGSAMQDGSSVDSDHVMSGMTPAEDAQTQETSVNGTGSSVGESMDTSTTSFTSINSQSQEMSASHKEPYTTDEIDEQVRRVQDMGSRQIDEGSRGVVISNTWLQRVLSRSTEGLRNNQYSKEAREGNVGPLDNSDIVPKGAFEGPYLQDAEKADFIPLKPNLRMDEDISVLPFEAYGYIIGTYGCINPSRPIIRYAHDTADSEATQTNIMYNLYPPVITVRKVPQPSDEDSPQQAGSRNSWKEARLQKEREGRGQRSPDDAAQLVCSQRDKAMTFLTRAKEAANIPLGTKVKVWRQLDPATIAVDEPNSKQSGVLSPPASRSASPAKTSATKLVVEPEQFSKYEIGKDIEAVDLADQTHNSNYNGKRDLETVTLGYSQTIILEEQTGGPGGGEFQSDSKKGIKSVLDRKSTASRPGSIPTSGRTSPAPGGMITRGRKRKDGRTIGTVGLSNLGNTCYMNSALQCIRSVEELAVYFLTKKYKPEINNDNPLGHHGAMANAYYGVINGIYGGQSSAFTPSDFKRTLGKLAPTFSGYGQQDSQEFLSFLVDGLHEDLNRILKKPYIENPDSDDDKVRDPAYIHELGETYRKNHKARNDSVAMDLFSGHYKNTMECPVCDKVSVTFDPYSLLTVQLPMDVAFTHDVAFIPLHGTPVIHNIDMDKNSSVKALKEYIAKKHSTDAERLWMAEVYSHKIYKVFDDQTPLSDAGIQTNDRIFIYETDTVPTNKPSGKKTFYTMSKIDDPVPTEGMDSPKADVIAVPIFNRVKNTNREPSHDMHPLYITLTREEAKDCDKILKKVLVAVSNTTSRNILSEFAEESSPNGAPKGEAEADKDQGNDDSAGISDHSAQSEDSYVNVSRNKQEAAAQSNGESPMQIDSGDQSTVPPGFWNSDYWISPALRNQLFELNFAESSDSNMHCSSISSFNNNRVRPMHDRVKAQRRQSMQSSSSEESTGSTPSRIEANAGEDAESDEDDPEKPFTTLGEESTLSTTTVNDESSEDELAKGSPTPSTPNQHTDTDHSRGGRRKKNGKKGGRGKKNQRRNNKPNGKITYGKKDKAQYGSKQNQSRFSSSPSSSQQEDGPYYIQIGEAIVLDWYPEAKESLYEGAENDPSEMRGHRYLNDEGTHGIVFHDEELQARKSKRAERKKNGIDLEDCFAETSKREVLSSDNSWYCNRCKELRQAYKQLEIWTLPDILVVHMKRFGGNRSLRDKLDVMVDYPIEGLDMTDKVGLKEDGKEYIYDLFAVDNHFGGLGGGHYTAIAKNFFDGEWYDYNDSSCSKIGPGGRKSAAAYLLFYRRRSDKPLGPQYLQDLVSEYRTPPEAEENEDGDSGEGKLGGPVHSSQQLGGSSSASIGAGVVNPTNLSGKGLAGDGGAGAGSPLTQRQMTTTDSTEDGGNERGITGLLGYGEQVSWGFERIGDGNEHENDADDDADSTKAEVDNDDSGFDSSNRGSMFDDMDDSPGGMTGMRNSPEHEDTNMIYVDEREKASIDSDPPAVDLHLEDVNAATEPK